LLLRLPNDGTAPLEPTSSVTPPSPRRAPLLPPAQRFRFFGRYIGTTSARLLGTNAAVLVVRPTGADVGGRDEIRITMTASRSICRDRDQWWLLPAHRCFPDEGITSMSAERSVP
jgi:hypothetical protein